MLTELLGPQVCSALALQRVTKPAVTDVAHRFVAWTH